MERLACQAEGKWTQVYGNCSRESQGGREVYNEEFEMKPQKKVKGEAEGEGDSFLSESVFLACACRDLYVQMCDSKTRSKTRIRKE